MRIQFGSAMDYCVASTKAATGIGFHWDTDDQYVDAVRREVDEFVLEAKRHPVNRDALGSEVGDMLMSATALAVRHGLDPEQELRAATDRFNQRLTQMKAMIPKPIAQMDLAEKWHWFKAAKKALANA